MMRTRARSSWLPLAVAFLLPAPAASEVTFDWVTVGEPGNAPDPDPNTQLCGQSFDQPCGAVAYAYRIGKYEVTNAQYAEFLNAKAAADPLGLYNERMGLASGGITRSGISGSFTYSTVAGREDKPARHVSFYDTLRFINWLNNGQGSGDTETGAYTLLGGTATPSNGGTVTRNAGASIFLTSEDEWYKAAYYDAVSTSYNPYPFADGFAGVVCESPAGTTTHSANCNFAVNDTTDVGAYTTSPSASGTFDQGGNISEWNEDLLGLSRRRRAGDYGGDPINNAATRVFVFGPSNESGSVGFRVASIPEAVPSLSLGGMLVLAAGLLVMMGLLGLAGWRRPRA
jgi:formylglycine-generating enzyme required for sulfatase activity